MVSQQKLERMELADLRAYFAYILESYTVGQIAQTKELIDDMSLEQKIGFVSYMGAFADEDQKAYINNYLIGTGNRPINF